MKPAPFTYHAPDTVEEAIGLLDEFSDDDPKVLAGGQSLVPIMNLRLARPGHLIDINRIPGLGEIDHNGTHLTIGALVRHADIEDSAVVETANPLLREVSRQIGYRQIRYRGTVCGSVCHADPVAEWPMIMRLLDARFDIAGPGGVRSVESDEFFVHLFTTALAPDEILTHAHIPLPKGRWSWGFSEFARKAGDFAVVASAAIIETEDGLVKRASIALAGGGPTPLRAAEAEQLLEGVALDDDRSLLQAAEAVAEFSQPTGDIHGTADFRRRLVQVQTARALQQAFGRSAMNAR